MKELNGEPYCDLWGCVLLQSCPKDAECRGKAEICEENKDE